MKGKFKHLTKLSSDEIISEMHQDIKEIKEQLLPVIQTELAVVKVKAGLFGTIGGLGAGLIALFIPRN